MASTVSVASTARQPRGMIKVNGAVMPGWIEWEVDNNTHYQADTFRASFALSGLPPAYNAAWWSAQPKLEVEIFAGFPANPSSFSADDLTSLFFGRVDDLDPMDLAAGLIEVTGRDLTSEFIETKTSQKYPNLTSAQIATQLAQAHGLTPVVTATSTKVGRYYEIDKVRLQDDRTEWDLMTWLAREEQFDVFVRGQSLYFQPKADASSPSRTFNWTPRPANGGWPSFNGQGIRFRRSLTLAKDITVEVRSWNAKQKKAFVKTAKATHTKSPVLKGQSAPTYDAQTYSYVIANLTPDQAQARANQLLAELSAHEMKCTIEGPADNDLSAEQVIAVAGTGTAFDQAYFPDSIVRSMDADGGGYRWTITAKNHPPESDADL